MTQLSLTFEQAQELRALHARTGGSYAMVGLMFGVSAAAAWHIVNHVTYLAPTQRFDKDVPPTPVDQITVADVDRIHRDGRWDVPLPSTTLSVRMSPHIDQPRYSTQNDRDGYLTDPEYLAAVRAWRDEPLPVAVD